MGIIFVYKKVQFGREYKDLNTHIDGLKQMAIDRGATCKYLLIVANDYT
jgi:hypothetical protein